eukprot:CAMPEP_0170171588 /NCGR_PEP_ID=MMETSP0040_2-20121228/4748_1 /TAXON_ID=641309 /ORGANISM="Lotharella oceanica, Strain CCMP622" /LENGTH=437 /DNA_ID=CAMNT_0010411729 /DNA_START=6 /DNA_END=1320 /DNA_ORIENTATION=-
MPQDKGCEDITPDEAPTKDPTLHSRQSTILEPPSLEQQTEEDSDDSAKIFAVSAQWKRGPPLFNRKRHGSSIGGPPPQPLHPDVSTLPGLVGILQDEARAAAKARRFEEEEEQPIEELRSSEDTQSTRPSNSTQMTTVTHGSLGPTREDDLINGVSSRRHLSSVHRRRSPTDTPSLLVSPSPRSGTRQHREMRDVPNIETRLLVSPSASPRSDAGGHSVHGSESNLQWINSTFVDNSASRVRGHEVKTSGVLTGGKWYFIDSRVWMRFGPVSSQEIASIWQSSMPRLDDQSMVWNKDDKKLTTWRRIENSRNKCETIVTPPSTKVADVRRIWPYSLIFPVVPRRFLRKISKENAVVPEDMIWFYTGSNQERKGPISRTYLLNLFWEGKITFTTLVWCRAMDRYAQLQDVPMLVDFFHKTKPLPEIPERIAKEMKRCT